MMGTTHLYLGLTLAGLVRLLLPAYADVALPFLLIGSVAPDLDLLFEHRKTLHAPVYFNVLAGIFVVVAAVWPLPGVIGIAALFTGLAGHCLLDLCGNGIGPSTWRYEWDRGIYNHWMERWEEPWRVLKYAGSERDIAAMVVLAIVPSAIYGTWFMGLTLVLVILLSIAWWLRPRMRAMVPDPVLERFVDRQDFSDEARSHAFEDVDPDWERL